MTTKASLFFLLFCLCIHVASAQRFGGNHPSIKWMQINTDSLRVVFPKGNKAQAIQVINTSLYVNEHERFSIGNKFRKLNIVLQPSTVSSNGFVTLSPFRAVFQTTPPFDNFSLGTDNWLTELSIHETWHALQNMNFRTGLGKTFGILFGENGESLVTHSLIPDWYWEGDAVFMETKLTNQGRGRLPSFMEPLKSIYYADKHYKFAKIRNGSYRDLIPDVYPWGYMMTAYGREKYGYDFWETILQESLLNRKVIREENEKHPERPFHLFKYGFYPLAAVLRYHTDENIRTFYASALSHFEETWEREKQDLQPTPADTLREASHTTVLNYRYPHISKEGEILAVKTGYARHPEIVSINKAGKDKRIVRLGNTLDPYFSYGDNRLVWAEYRPDPRWGWKSYSVLRIHDMHSGNTKTITHKSRYYSPALSPDGQTIVAVEVPENKESRLVLLKAANGHVKKELANPEHYYFTYPVFGNTKNTIIAGARDSLGKMALVKINIANGVITSLTPFLPKALGPAVNQSKYIYFPASYKNEIQLFALQKKDKQLFQIAKRPLGNYSLGVDSLQQRIVFNEYTASGFQLLSLPEEKQHWKKVNLQALKKIPAPFVPKALSFKGTQPILNKIPSRQYAVSSYHPLTHLFRLHSWAFMSAYPETGFYLQSQDILNTLQLNVGGGYNFNEQAPFADANLLYGGLFPFLQGGIKETFNREDFIADTIPVRWNEVNWYSGFYVPLNLSGSLYQRSLTFSASYHQSNLYFKASRPVKKQVISIPYLSAGVSFQNVRNRTVQEINPRFGVVFSTGWNRTLDHQSSEQLTTKLNLFLPGLFTNHSLYFTTAYSETQNRSHYKFNDDFSYAFGYHSIPYKNIYTLGANYQLPIAYPDWGLTWAYLLRVRLHLFYDYSHATLLKGYNPKIQNFRSAGLTIYFDTKILNALNIPIGIRYSRLFDKDPNAPGRKDVFSLSIPVNLF